MQAVGMKSIFPVLIPMWWGGFSESLKRSDYNHCRGLNPHVVGRFFREIEFSKKEVKALRS